MVPTGVLKGRGKHGLRLRNQQPDLLRPRPGDRTAGWRCWCAIVNGVPFVPDPGCGILGHVCECHERWLVVKCLFSGVKVPFGRQEWLLPSGCSDCPGGGGTVLSGHNQVNPLRPFCLSGIGRCSLSHLLGPHPPSTCSRRLPRYPVRCLSSPVQSCPVCLPKRERVSRNWEQQPTFRDCLTDSSPIFLVPTNPHPYPALPCPPQ